MERFDIEDIQFVIRSLKDPTKFLKDVISTSWGTIDEIVWVDLAEAWKYQSGTACDDAESVNGEVMILIHNKLYLLTEIHNYKVE